MSADGYLEAEIAKRVKPVTDAEVSAFYTANIKPDAGADARADGADDHRYLTDQRRAQARDAILTSCARGAGDSRRARGAAVTLAVSPSNPSVGSASAPITLIEFSDYQCPYCGRVEPTLKRLRAAYGDKIRFVWKDFPLTQIHPQAFKAGEAAHCAGDQGKYWELHDVLFNKQSELQLDDLKRHALTLGLKTDDFNQCLDSSKYAERVRDGVSEGGQLGVNSTPTVFINGRRFSGAQPYEVFAAVIDEELAEEVGRRFRRRPERTWLKPPPSTRHDRPVRSRPRRLRDARPARRAPSVRDGGVHAGAAARLLPRVRGGHRAHRGLSSGDEPALVVRDLTGA
jgi:protein-disulfide isomerase